MSMVLTRAQRVALKRKFDQCPIYHGGTSASKLVQQAGWEYRLHERSNVWCWTHPNRKAVYHEAEDIVADLKLATPLSYRGFRKLVQHGSDCVMVPWCGMWLGIEPDGYTHS